MIKSKLKNKKNYFQSIIDNKKNPNRKKYYAFIKRKRNNVFFTITGTSGNVIISQSAGCCGITSKKKKRSPDTIKSVATSISKFIKAKNIIYIYKLFSTFRRVKFIRPIYDSFKSSGVTILQNTTVQRKPHSMPMRKKKVRRL